MFRLFILLLVMTTSVLAKAQIRVSAENPGVDTLQVVFYDDKWAIPHAVKAGETIFVISKKYHVPPALLADMNGVNFQTRLQEGRKVYVPFGPYNQAKSVKGNRVDVRPLYFIVRKYDNLFRLSHLAGVRQKTIQAWNGMTDNYIEEGQRLHVGWVLYEQHVKRAPKNVIVNDNNEDDLADVDEQGSDADLRNKGYGKMTRKVITNEKGEEVVVYTRNLFDTLPPIQKKYMAQTQNETVIKEEKGKAVFYENKGKISGSGIYFAFHDTAARGTIIKVHNPGTDKTVYVKVLGKMPNAKLYHNSIIGISDGAKEALLVTEDKAWCELTYAPPPDN